jgi:hypothetical protein
MRKILSILFLLAFTAQASHAQSEYSFSEKYAVATPAKLSISSSDGNIEVLPGTGKQFEVFYIVRKGNKILKISRKELEKDLTLVVEPGASSLSIQVKYPNEWSFTGIDRIRVSFRVLVPAETATVLHSSDGNIILTGLKGPQECKTSDGNIGLENIQGNVSARTSDGNVTASSVRGVVELRTSDGNIKADDIEGNTSANTSDGNVALRKVTGNVIVSSSDGQVSFEDIAGSLKVSTSDGNVRGTMTKLEKELAIRTSDGSIDVTIPERLGLDLDIKGESLHIPLSNFSGTSDEKVIRGSINGGGIPVSLSTDGRVSLTYR